MQKAIKIIQEARSLPLKKPKTKANTILHKMKGFCYNLSGYICGLFLPDEISFLGFPSNPYPSSGTALAQCIEILSQKGYIWTIEWTEEMPENDQVQYMEHLKKSVEQLKPRPLSIHALSKQP